MSSLRLMATDRMRTICSAQYDTLAIRSIFETIYFGCMLLRRTPDNSMFCKGNDGNQKQRGLCITVNPC
jgi:hypothetical protein